MAPLLWLTRLRMAATKHRSINDTSATCHRTLDTPRSHTKLGGPRGHDRVLGGGNARGHGSASVEIELRVVGGRHGVAPGERQQMRRSTENRLLDASTTAEAKVMQTRRHEYMQRQIDALIECCLNRVAVGAGDSMSRVMLSATRSPACVVSLAAHANVPNATRLGGDGGRIPHMREDGLEVGHELRELASGRDLVHWQPHMTRRSLLCA